MHLESITLVVSCEAVLIHTPKIGDCDSNAKVWLCYYEYYVT